MLQQITMVGNLGSDPQLRYTPQEVPVCNFPLAVYKQWQTETGEQGQKTLWFRITVWGQQAELVNRYLSKGRRAMVVGEIAEVRPYYSRSGDPAVAVEVTAHTVQFLDRGQVETEAEPRPVQLRMLDEVEFDVPLV